MITNSQFLVDIYNESNKNITALTQNLLSYKSHKINGALADFLLHYNNRGCLQFLKQKEISEILGYSRENVCKCLHDLSADGHIEYTDESITILNEEALKTVKQFG